MPNTSPSDVTLQKQYPRISEKKFADIFYWAGSRLSVVAVCGLRPILLCGFATSRERRLEIPELCSRQAIKPQRKNSPGNRLPDSRSRFFKKKKTHRTSPTPSAASSNRIRGESCQDNIRRETKVKRFSSFFRMRLTVAYSFGAPTQTARSLQPSWYAAAASDKQASV